MKIVVLVHHFPLDNENNSIGGWIMIKKGEMLSIDAVVGL